MDLDFISMSSYLQEDANCFPSILVGEGYACVSCFYYVKV